ncbi:LysR family transcriptional regulator [Phenylobacterium sp.]|uniref:LysR family transcriptional regulator n=1 Tax=Phenylobacterium sp. TaxID=1871053 RepID=UPI0035AE79A6
MLLRRHNLNLLPIMRELLRTRSVARSAEVLGLSQSAVSAALARLRVTYDDQLLVMIGRRLELTEKGHQLIEQTERACVELETLLRPPEFDPSSETRQFVVAAADYITFLLAPQLSKRLTAQAPQASVHFVDYSSDLLGLLTRGRVDLVAMPESTSGHLGQGGAALLFSDDIVAIASKANKGFTGPLTRTVYEDAPHAMFQVATKGAQSHESLLVRSAGVRQRNVILTDQFLTLPAIVEASDSIALVQRQLAERFQRSNAIEIHEAPFDTAPVRIFAYWGASTERDPAHRWFRELLIEVAQAL